MSNEPYTPSERILFGTSLILAPLFQALSTFFWVGEGQYGITSSTLLVSDVCFGQQHLSVYFDCSEKKHRAMRQ